MMTKKDKKEGEERRKERKEERKRVSKFFSRKPFFSPRIDGLG